MVLALGLLAALAALGVVYGEAARLALLSRQSTDTLRRAARDAPGDAVLARAAARRLLAEGKAADARSLLAGPVQAHPADVELQVLLARALLETSEPASAGTLLKRVLEEHPEEIEARYWLAEALYRQGYEEMARDLYEEVTTLRPGFAPAWERAGELRLMAEHYTDALQRLDRAERLAPTASVARLRGAALRSLGRAEEAEQAVREAARRNPDDALARYALGDVLQASGSLPEAREHLERAAQLNPTADTLKLLAVVCRRQSDHRSAINVLRKMIALAPGSADGYLLLGQSYQALGRPSLARKVLAIYLRLEPLEKQVSRAVYRVNISRGDPAAQVALVRTYLAVGRHDLARDGLVRLRRRAPGHPELPALESQARGEPTLRIPPLPPDPEATAP